MLTDYIEKHIENLKTILVNSHFLGLTSEQISSIGEIIDCLDGRRFYGRDLYNLQCLIADNVKQPTAPGPEVIESLKNLVGQVSVCRYNEAAAKSKVWQYKQELKELVMLGKRTERFLDRIEKNYSNLTENNEEDENV